ncbi:hypothetical protein GCM10027614_68720 [Micromonospora vulcania]
MTPAESRALSAPRPDTTVSPDETVSHRTAAALIAPARTPAAEPEVAEPETPTKPAAPTEPETPTDPEAPSEPAADAGADAEATAPGATRRRRWTRRRQDLAVGGLFLLAALWVTSRLWLDPSGRAASLYTGDPAQVQFFLAHSVRVVLHGEYPFYTEQFNYPDGVNLMANTAVLALGIPMVPVTLLFGPAVSFVVLVTLGLAGTAMAWYAMLSRQLVRTPLAAAAGGWFCGFSPAMLSHASWHPNIINQFLLPFIVWRVLALTRSQRPVRDGALLALLVSAQAFINEEILLFTALACGVFLLAVLAQEPARWSAAWRPLAVGLAACALLAGALLAYPLYVQFAGPMAYHGLSDAVQDYGNDVAAFFAPGSPTLGGNQRANVNLAPNYSRRTPSSVGACRCSPSASWCGCGVRWSSGRSR